MRDGPARLIRKLRLCFSPRTDLRKNHPRKILRKSQLLSKRPHTADQHHTKGQKGSHHSAIRHVKYASNDS